METFLHYYDELTEWVRKKFLEKEAWKEVDPEQLEDDEVLRIETETEICEISGFSKDEYEKKKLPPDIYYPQVNQEKTVR